ncbi:MAG: acyl-CoA dehydrogenase [Candidatus Margulisbacteria bacterium]|nr:acyl-CoA dehydrogenase [Candidatus Margulisiibacteriota bacterium]
MIELIYDFLYWPIYWYVILFISAALLTAWFKLPLITLSTIGILLLWASDVSPTILYSTIAIAAIFSIPFIRQHLVSRIILIVAKTLQIFPKVSKTEQAALDAGTVWMDKELFSGSPNIKRLMTQDIQGLTPDEQAFLSGPVTELCHMIDDWHIQKTKKIPDDVWTFIKDNRFLGMIIPKEHGGLGLSAIGHAAVIERIASVSATMAITIMVPNSLGPAELLLHYGTQDQKDRYLSKLATGEEMPCFGLTEPTAGSDAGGLQSEGIVFKGDDGELYLRFNWDKRWITLSGISTVIGLAFLLKDPNQLLNGATNYGITCALIPTNTPGVDVSLRHDPLGVPFMNCPTKGRDVVMPLSCVIGGTAGIGNGWTMLMDCLSAGRGISLPSLSSGGAQALVRASSSFGVIRQQFGMSIGQFEGIQEPLARIVGQTFILTAGRNYTCGAIDQGEKPSVISAILKCHSTELFRKIVNDSMDIMGGAGITQGPRNVCTSAYKAAPIGITVEGANILTRTLIIFGQGALRCHPYAYNEVAAAEANNLKGFDRAFFGHIGHIFCNMLRAIVLTATQGLFSTHFGTVLSPYYRRLVWTSSVFALMADASMLVFGGALKSKQKITGRLGDVLSWMYLATATMVHYRSLATPAMKPILTWSLDYCFYNVQVALVGFFENFSWLTRTTLAPLFRWLPIGKYPSDALGKKVAQLIQADTAIRNTCTSSIFIPSNNRDGLSKLDTTYHQLIEIQPIVYAIKKSIKAKQLPKKPIVDVLDEAVIKNICTPQDAERVRLAEHARLDAIQVDAFTHQDYFSQS